MPLSTRIRNVIYGMAKKEPDVERRTEMKKALALVINKDKQALGVIDAERSLVVDEGTPPKGFSQDAARGVLMMCTNLEVDSVCSAKSKASKK